MTKKPPLKNLLCRYRVEFTIFFVAKNSFCTLFCFNGAKALVYKLYFTFEIEQRDKMLDSFFHLFLTASIGNSYNQCIDIPLFQKSTHITCRLISILAQNRFLRKSYFAIEAHCNTYTLQTDIECCNFICQDKTPQTLYRATRYFA